MLQEEIPHELQKALAARQQFDSLMKTHSKGLEDRVVMVGHTCFALTHSSAPARLPPAPAPAAVAAARQQQEKQQQQQH
jgi:hypothetical protein